MILRAVAQWMRLRRSLFVLLHRAKKPFQHPVGQGFRPQHLDVRPVFKCVEDELAVVAVGEFEEVVAVLRPAPLFREGPVFLGDPAGALGGEA
jgi:hypothetical protein